MLPTTLQATLLERTLSFLDAAALKRAGNLAPAQQVPTHLATGHAGEDAAFFHLMRKGYTVAARRWSAGHVPGDVDLIAWQGETLCFIEVKTRTARDVTPAEAAVDDHKRNTLRKLARTYLRQLPRATVPAVRFDVMSVYLASGRKPEIQHFEGAFGWDSERQIR